MASKYYLLFKTAQAEFRAWSALNFEMGKAILPIIELTRGRKISKSGKGLPADKLTKTPGIYDFNGNLDKVKTAFKESSQIIIDLTREESLSCSEIDALSQSNNGYNAWIDFLLAQKPHFTQIIPTLLVNPSDDEDKIIYKENIQKQFDKLILEFNGVAYRASVLIDPAYMYDLIILKDKINASLDKGKKFFVELDHEFIHPKTGELHGDRTSRLIDAIYKIIPKAEIIILSTSFPKSIEEIGNPEHDSFPIEEENLYESIAKINKTNALIFYGDYGSINPLRFDQVGARGWRPRIDFPTSKRLTFYYREKRDKNRSYESHYISVAKKVVNDARFEDISNSWGVAQIKQAANGNSPGNSPSFWISVRMEIHILQQLRRLGVNLK